ncbi:A/G-specific adenine glycosylase [Fodinicurvata sp. EGI_FJ10296]|uniref:A/G-specific adenine glycosylase n=1 Tax=Fodinicurvata sp. EGI_FJ10296 TaxID=3231908 RepID=UPI00345703E2
MPGTMGNTVESAQDEDAGAVDQAVARDRRVRLLTWYDHHRRALPWRALPGGYPDPYHVWLSEIMLQQTTVATVKSYFEAFVSRWPTVEGLAAAELDSVLQAWAGLGYYARARNLHRCAGTVVERHDGVFPNTVEELRQLPGVGDYTAAAVAAIAFGRPATVVDGNIERVVARLFNVATPLPRAKPELKRLAGAFFPDSPGERPGDVAQALMDLGATICTPRKPRCILCPLSAECAARLAGTEAGLPAKKAKPPKPVRRGIVFWAVNGKGDVFLRRRAEKGLLGGMMEVPSSEWLAEADFPALDAAAKQAPLPAGWRLLPGMVRHTFTHFHLELKVAVARIPYAPVANGRWVALEALGDEALPTVMRKVVRHALAHGTRIAE